MRYWFPEHYAQVVQKLRVPLGFVLIAAFLLLAAPTAFSLVVGLPVAALGIGVRAWAAGHLAKDQALAISGPYARVRNPLYLGTLLAAGGFAIASAVWWLPVASALVFLLVYLPVMEREDQHLRKIFRGYEEYASRVPLLLPARSGGIGGTDSFRGSLWLRNEEYKGLIAFAVVCAYLIWLRT